LAGVRKLHSPPNHVDKGTVPPIGREPRERFGSVDRSVRDSPRYRVGIGVRLERFPERDVEVDRPRFGASRRADRPSERRPERSELPVGGLGFGKLPIPPDRSAVEVLLIDRLVGAAVGQLRRAVGGQKHHRNAGRIGLHDRRVEVRERGPRGTDERGGHSRSLRVSEGEKRRRALVEL